MSQSVPDVLGELDARQGETVSVRGMLVVPAEGAFLVALDYSPERSMVPDWEAADRLVILHPHLVDRLFESVFAYVGGPLMYRDPAIVTGRLIRHPEKGPALTDLHRLTVLRGNEEFEVRLGAR